MFTTNHPCLNALNGLEKVRDNDLAKLDAATQQEFDKLLEPYRDLVSSHEKYSGDLLRQATVERLASDVSSRVGSFFTPIAGRYVGAKEKILRDYKFGVDSYRKELTDLRDSLATAALPAIKAAEPVAFCAESQQLSELLKRLMANPKTYAAKYPSIVGMKALVEVAFALELQPTTLGPFDTEKHTPAVVEKFDKAGILGKFKAMGAALTATAVVEPKDVSGRKMRTNQEVK